MARKTIHWLFFSRKQLRSSRHIQRIKHGRNGSTIPERFHSRFGYASITWGFGKCKKSGNEGRRHRCRYIFWAYWSQRDLSNIRRIPHAQSSHAETGRGHTLRLLRQLYVFFHFVESNQKLIPLFSAARRARQFYRMRETSLCDICEGSDCDKNCEIRASEQKSFFENIEKETGTVSGRSQSHSSIKTASSVLLMVTTTIWFYLIWWCRVCVEIRFKRRFDVGIMCNQKHHFYLLKFTLEWSNQVNRENVP